MFLACIVQNKGRASQLHRRNAATMCNDQHAWSSPEVWACDTDMCHACRHSARLIQEEICYTVRIAYKVGGYSDQLLKFIFICHN